MLCVRGDPAQSYALLELIDATKGIEEQTRKLFEVCRLRNVPIVTVDNELAHSIADRPLDPSSPRRSDEGEVRRLAPTPVLARRRVVLRLSLLTRSSDLTAGFRCRRRGDAETAAGRTRAPGGRRGPISARHRTVCHPILTGRRVGFASRGAPAAEPSQSTYAPSRRRLRRRFRRNSVTPAQRRSRSVRLCDKSGPFVTSGLTAIQGEDPMRGFEFTY
jgi:hypothetical protein